MVIQVPCLYKYHVRTSVFVQVSRSDKNHVRTSITFGQGSCSEKHHVCTRIIFVHVSRSNQFPVCISIIFLQVSCCYISHVGTMPVQAIRPVLSCVKYNSDGPSQIVKQCVHKKNPTVVWVFLFCF